MSRSSLSEVELWRIQRAGFEMPKNVKSGFRDVKVKVDILTPESFSGTPLKLCCRVGSIGDLELDTPQKILA